MLRGRKRQSAISRSGGTSLRTRLPRSRMNVSGSCLTYYCKAAGFQRRNLMQKCSSPPAAGKSDIIVLEVAQQMGFLLTVRGWLRCAAP